MPPWSFHEFRRYLGTASGVQSQQFREIELLSGLRDPTFLAAIERALKASPSPAVARRREQRSVAEAHRDAAHAIGIADFAELYAEPAAHPDFWLLSETLVDYDAQWMRWRYEHILLVERAVGPRARGTGGTPAISFLSSRGGLRFFPYLWAARNDLSVRSGGELVP
jgi:tryptophan 2,3-dioxygenase